MFFNWSSPLVFICVCLGFDAWANDAGAISGHSIQTSRTVRQSVIRGCNKDQAAHFYSGFDEGGVLRSLSKRQSLDFLIPRQALSCVNAVNNGQQTHVKLAWPVFQFQGGRSDERFVVISKDVENAANDVLHFGLRNPNVEVSHGHFPKGRVQMNFYRNEGIKQLKMKVRMYLHPNMSLIRSYSEPMDWLTISEWWNNAGWTGEPYPFRISVNIVKEKASAEAPLFFQVKAETLNPIKRRWAGRVWKETARDFAIPVGRWINLEYGFREGDATRGRFFMAATPEGGARSILFDITSYTHHPDDPSPDGLSDFNPLKLYTSGKLINHVRSLNGTMEIFWDNLDVYACGKYVPGSNKPCEF